MHRCRGLPRKRNSGTAAGRIDVSNRAMCRRHVPLWSHIGTINYLRQPWRQGNEGRGQSALRQGLERARQTPPQGLREGRIRDERQSASRLLRRSRPPERHRPHATPHRRPLPKKPPRAQSDHDLEDAIPEGREKGGEETRDPDAPPLRQPNDRNGEVFGRRARKAAAR